MKKNFVALCLTLFLCGAAHAALVETDYYDPGDGLITLDNIAHLEWLDLTQSTPNSPLSYAINLSPDGWQIATRAQVNTLISNNLGPNPAQITTFVSLFGTTYDENGDAAGSVSWGRFLETGSTTSMDALVVRDDNYSYSIIDAANIYTPHSFSGTLFVRPSAVPVPATVWLLGSGLVLFARFRKKK